MKKKAKEESKAEYTIVMGDFKRKDKEMSTRGGKFGVGERALEETEFDKY